MVNQKTPKECFQELEADLMAIAENVIVFNTMPYEVATQEGLRMSALAEKYHDQLIKSDIDPAYLDTIYERAGAFAYCVAVMDSFVKVSQNHKEIYIIKKKEGYELRRRLLDTLEYVFRFDNTIPSAIENIKRGAGDLDMIRDLNAIHLLCTENLDRLIKAHVDQSLIDMAQQYFKELSQLTAKIDIDPKKISEARLMCGRAWTYLWEAMKEIYAAGRFVFYSEPDILELFYIDYYQRMGKISTKNTEDKEAIPEKEEESTETSTSVV